MKFHYPSEGFKINVQLTEWEIGLLQEVMKVGYPKVLKSLQKKIDKLKNHPKNEGQVTFQNQISDIESEMNHINQLNQELS